MTAPGRLPTRLLAESLLIVALAAAAVLWLAPALLPPLAPTLRVMAQVAGLLLLAAPALYWRAMQATRQASHASQPPGPGTGVHTVVRLEGRRRRAIAMTAVAQFAGIGCTALVVGYLQQQIDTELARRFERRAERLELELQRRFERPASALKAARAARSAQAARSTAQFARYVAVRDPQHEFPGVRGFGVLAAAIGEAAPRPVLQLEPPDAPGAPRPGQDLAADPALRQAIAQALASGQPALSRLPPAAAGSGPAADFLLLLAEPGGQLLFAPIVLAELLQGAAEVASDGTLDFQLFDGAAQSGPPLFDTSGIERSAGAQIQTRRMLVIGDHELLLQARTTDRFEALVDRRPLLYTGLGGALLSLLMALVVWSLASSRIRAQTLAERMTADLDRLAQVVRHTSNAVTITDPQLRITWINEGFTRITGYDSASALGQRPGDLLASGQADPAALRELAAAAAAGRACRVEILNRARNGRLFWVDTEIQPLHDANGRLAGFMEIATDITDKRQAAEELLATSEALSLARDRAEQASVAKSRFLANMSHEIRTPMNAVLGMLKLLGRSGLDERQRDYAGKAEGAARALLGLLNDILDFSKVEAGKLALDPRPFRPRRLLVELEVILAANLGGKPVALRIEIDPTLPEVLVGDDLRLQQVLVNLAGNALKFTARGEVVVSLQVLAAPAGAEAEPGDSPPRVRLGFAVRDTGIGIAPEQQQSIFDVFSQAEASTTRRFGGTGLGLSICQRLVGMMGGQISLQSEPGVGSCFGFELVLPLGQAADLPQAAAADGSTGPRLAGLRLLVVEDNANNQQVAQELLEAEGARVALAGDGAQALLAVEAALQAGPPFDAVLMDLQMPVMDGLSATRALRERGHTRLPIVAMTANALAGDREASLAAGMNDHVGKPFDLDRVVAVLLALLPEAAARQPAAPAAPQPGLPAALLNQAQARGIQLAAAVARLGGRPAVWQRSAAAFGPELARTAERLGELQQARNWAGLAALAHTLKGVSATLGAEALAARAATLEAAARNTARDPSAPAPLAEAQALLPQLLDTRAGLAALVDLLSDQPGNEPAAKARHAAGLAAALAALAPLLAADDMAATDAWAELEQAHGEAWSEALAPLADAMAALDFARARRCCSDLRASLPTSLPAAETGPGRTPAATA